MRKWNLLAGVVLALVVAVAAVAAEKAQMVLKPGDEVYVCNCGEKCPCEMMAKQEGNCTCGNPLAKGKVTKVEPGKAVVSINGKEQSFKTAGKYACACGPTCKCGSISQTPGKCVCGSPMEPVAAK